MKYFFTLFLFIACLPLLFAQDAYYNQILLTLNGHLGLPQDRFQDNIDAVGLGFGGSMLFRMRDKPVYIGFEGGWMNYAHEKLPFTVQVDGFFEDYEWRTNSNILHGHAVARFQPDVVFPIKPYFEGLAGFKNLYTRSKLVFLDGEDDDVVERERNLNDWAFSYGGAIGVHIAYWEHVGVRIDLKVTYLQGQNAQYMARLEDPPQVLDFSIDAFEERIGPTNMLIPQIGVVLDLLYLGREELGE